MRGAQQRAELRELTALERRHSRVHALVLADHMAQAPVERGGEARGVVGVAERLEAEQLERAAALLATLVVARRREAARCAGVERGEHVAVEVQLDRDAPRACACRAAAARPSSPSSDASWSSRPVSWPAHSLSTREHSRASLTGRGGSRAGGAVERERERHAEGRGGGEAHPLRQVAADGEPHAGQLHLRTAQLRERALEEAVAVLEVRRDDLAAVVQLGCHGHAELDRERQAKSVVVIGVFADQVHASRRESPDPMRGHGRHPTSHGRRPWTHWRTGGTARSHLPSTGLPVHREGGTEATQNGSGESLIGERRAVQAFLQARPLSRGSLEVELRAAPQTSDPRSGEPVLVPPLVVLWIEERPVAVRVRTVVAMSRFPPEPRLVVDARGGLPGRRPRRRANPGGGALAPVLAAAAAAARTRLSLRATRNYPAAGEARNEVPRLR